MGICKFESNIIKHFYDCYKVQDMFKVNKDFNFIYKYMKLGVKQMLYIVSHNDSF